MIYQAQEKGCGYAAVKNLLQLNGFKNAEALAEPPIAEKAPSLGELIAYASEHGLALSGYKFLEPSGLSSCNCFPLLCLLTDGPREHLVLVKKRKKRRYFVCDPAEGESWRKEEEILSKFTGVYLKQLSYSPKGEKQPLLAKIKRPAFSYILPLFPALEAAIAFFAVSFFASENNFTSLLLLMAAYCLLILARSVFLMAGMEQFDAKWAFGLAKTEKEEREEALRHYLSYKKASIVPWVSLPENVVCFAFVFFLVAINEPLFASLTLIPFASFFLDKTLLGRREKRKKDEVATLEKEFLDSEEDSHLRMGKLNALFSKVSSYTRRELSKKAILVLLCLVSSCIGLLGGEFTCNRFLLFVFSSLYLVSLGEKIYEDGKSIETEKRERPYFYQHFVRASDSNKTLENGNI